RSTPAARLTTRLYTTTATALASRPGPASPDRPSDSTASSSLPVASTGASARTPVTLPVALVVMAAPSHWPWYSAAMLSMIGTNALDPSTDSLPVAHCAESAGRDHETISVASSAPVSSTPTAVVMTGQPNRR